MSVSNLTLHSPDTDQTPAEFIKARGNTLQSEIHKLVHFIWNKKEMRWQWKESITAPVYKKRY
jgi:hypothetical protein